MAEHDHCDWREHKMHILTQLVEIQASIETLREEMKAKEADRWQPWKYVLLGAAIAVPQIMLEVSDKLAMAPPP